MKKNLQSYLVEIIKNSLRDLDLDKSYQEGLYLDFPSDIRFGDLSTNVALRLSSSLKKNPFDIATSLIGSIKKHLEKSPCKDYIKEIKVEGAGFINFYLHNNYFYEQLKNIITKDRNYLKKDYGKGRRVLIEFVSANPTGPLSVAHARQGVVGDVLANILDFLGFRVKREYYLNDEGNQINILGESIDLRLRELSGENLDFPQDHYQGEYIYEIAKKIKKSLPADRQEKSKIKNFSEYGVKYILDIIKKELDDFGVKFDYWYSQKELRKSGKIKNVLEFLKQKGLLYEQEGARWFKSTQFGDDKDRVVVKSDNSYTYLAPDIAYHRDKFKRGFSWLINLWGPDHHGYINRLKAAVMALGKSQESLSIIIVQLASIFRSGRPVQMSTRRGQYITLREVLDEVGPDASRFFFLMRRTSSHLDFDLDIAKKNTPENPVYYIQYAHARICGILQNAESSACRRDTPKRRCIRHSPQEIKLKDADFTLLKEKEEIELIKKLWQFSYILDICLNTLDPYMLTVYLQELAEDFHKFYDQYRVLGQENKLTEARIILLEATKKVIALSLKLLGISRPERM